MAVNVAFTARNLDKIKRDVEGMERRLKEPGPAMRVAAQLLKRFVDDRFQSSTDPRGNPWEPLDPKTVEGRRGASVKILVDTGRLRNSITVSYDGTTLHFGTAAAYGGFHQSGTVHLPAREFFPVEQSAAGWSLIDDGPSRALLDQMARAIETYVATGRVKV